MDDFDETEARLQQALVQGGGQLRGGQRYHPRLPALALGESGVEIAAGGQRHHFVAVGKVFADGEGALADGTGRGEDGKLLHSAIFADTTVEGLWSGL